MSLSMRPLHKRKPLYYGCKVQNRAAIIFWEDKHTAFALSLTFDLASIRFKVRPFKLLRTPSPHDHLPRLPILRILSEQSRRFLLGAEQHNRPTVRRHAKPLTQSLFCVAPVISLISFVIVYTRRRKRAYHACSRNSLILATPA